jgi:hypothetical protein
MFELVEPPGALARVFIVRGVRSADAWCPFLARRWSVQIDGTDSVSPTECWSLLTTMSVRRLVLSLQALPAILPVQCYVDGGNLAICLGHFSVPPESINDVVVAFGADAIDADRRTGWLFR